MLREAPLVFALSNRPQANLSLQTVLSPLQRNCVSKVSEFRESPYRKEGKAAFPRC